MAVKEVLAADRLRESIDALNEEAWALRKDDPMRATELSDEARKLSQTGALAATPYAVGIARSLCVQAGLSLYEGNPGRTLAQALEALSILEDQEETAAMPRALYLLACAYSDLGEYSETLAYSLRQLTISEELADREGIATALLLIGATYTDLGDHETALDYLRRSLDAFRELGDRYFELLLLNNLCEAYTYIGDYDSALAFGRKSLALAQADAAHPRVELLAHNKLGAVFAAMGDVQQALTHFQKSVALAREASYPDLMVETLLSAGQHYQDTGQAARAQAYAAEALQLATDASLKRYLARCHQLLSAASKQLGDLAGALAHYEAYHRHWEATFNEASDRKVKAMEALHRTQSAQKEVDYYAALYEEEQSRRLLAETLRVVGTALTSTLDLQAVLDQILAQLEPLVPYDRGSLLLKQDDYLVFKALRGFPGGKSYVQERIPLKSADRADVFQRIVESKRPLALQDVSAYEGWHQVGNLPVPGAWLGVPLIHNEEVIGMLSLVRRRPDPFTEDAITIVTAIASQAAVALENARLYGYVKQFNEQLEQEVQRRTEALAEAYQRLESLDKAKSDFIAVTAHELRTPITVLKGYGQLLQKSAEVAGNERLARLVTGIVVGADRLHSIVNTMLLMVKIDSRELTIIVEPLLCYELIGDIAVELAPDLAARQQTLLLDDSLQGLPTIEGDEELLPVVFRNVLINAIKYMPNGGTIAVSGSHWQAPPQPDLPADAVKIVVQDGGIGIPAAAQELIFDKFFRIESSSLHSTGQRKFKGGGPGLGLTIARGIVTAHHGAIWAESEGQDEARLPGTRLCIVLPCRQPRPD